MVDLDRCRKALGDYFEFFAFEFTGIGIITPTGSTATDGRAAFVTDGPHQAGDLDLARDCVVAMAEQAGLQQRTEVRWRDEKRAGMWVACLGVQASGVDQAVDAGPPSRADHADDCDCAHCPGCDACHGHHGMSELCWDCLNDGDEALEPCHEWRARRA